VCGDPDPDFGRSKLEDDKNGKFALEYDLALMITAPSDFTGPMLGSTEDSAKEASP